MAARRDPFQLLSRSELQRRRGKLLARICRQFEIVEQPFSFGSLELNFTRVVDPDVVLDKIIEEEDRRERATGERREGNALHLPYWAELWDSSIGVGQFLASNHDRVTRGQGDKVKKPNAFRHLVTLSPPHLVSILDLGCGMGLAGMVAAAMGHQVLLADLEPAAMLFATLNTLPYAKRCRIRQLNWQTDKLHEKFDLILGADVLYERAQWEYLDRFWQLHLADGGSVLLGEPGRQSGDLFIEWIKHRKWTLTQFEQAVATRPRPIRLFELNR